MIFTVGGSHSTATMSVALSIAPTFPRGCRRPLARAGPRTEARIGAAAHACPWALAPARARADARRRRCRTGARSLARRPLAVLRVAAQRRRVARVHVGRGRRDTATG